MNDTVPHSTLRQWRAHFSHPATWVVLAGIAAVLGVAGPFGTEDLLRLGPRVIYWLVTVSATYALGYLATNWVRRHLGPRLSPVPVTLAAAALTGCAVLIAVLGINLATFGYWPGWAEAVPFFVNVFAIALIITIVLQVVDRQMTTAATTAATPPLLDRLPLDKRAPLVALSVEDHYVRIRTTKGEDLVLLRLGDAMREVGATAGIQVHRSHWVAVDQVSAAQRKGDRAILTMAHGPDIPVSRRYVPAIKEAGLLP